MASAPRKSLEPYLHDSVEFYDHQVEGIRTLARVPNFLLADQMGLGKSLQTLALFTIDVKLGKARTMLIVCPVSLRENWADEIRKFTSFPVHLVGQIPNERLKSGYRMVNGFEREACMRMFLMEEGPRIAICNYEQVVSMAAAMNKCNIDFVVLDEAHLIKNPVSQRSIAARSLRRRRAGMLTGTPLLNQVTELWPILNMIDPHRWKSPEWFENRYAQYGGKNGRQVVGTKNVKELNEALAGVMLRRMKADVLTLPEPRIMQIKVDLHPEQRELYDALQEMRVLLDKNGKPFQDEDGEDIVIENDLERFLRYKQICGSSATIEGHDDHSIKLDRAVEIICETIANGEKIVVFTQFRPIQSLLTQRLKKYNIKLGELNGDVTPVRRQEIVRNWSKYPKPAALNCMIQVAGVGLNMTAARTGLFIDKLFVPGMNDQAIDRLHRIGQQEAQPVEIYELIARRTVEERIEEILKGKRLNNKEVVEESLAFQALYRELILTGGAP